MSTFTTRVYVIRANTGRYLKFYDEAANKSLAPGQTPLMEWTQDLNEAKLFASPAEIRNWVANHRWFDDRSFGKNPMIRMTGMPVEIEYSKISVISDIHAASSEL